MLGKVLPQQLLVSLTYTKTAAWAEMRRVPTEHKFHQEFYET